MKNFIEELRWRGMIHDITHEVELVEQLKEPTTAYIGFDPTADSLHVGSLVQIMLLQHLQRAGHKPIALIGGATGMIGDPSGKMEERKLLSLEDIRHNESCIKKQLEKFLDFNCGENSAEIVNNYDWFKDISTFTFLRDVGKFLTVSYLLSKGFIKDRLSEGGDISFTEFNYILMQAYDFYWLLENKNCKMQMGGSDQWGNITAGIELIRKKNRKQAFGLTCPLLVKADGGKFGKTESGNVWLDPAKTSPTMFRQFWLNVSDEDAEKYIKIFTLLPKEEIEKMIAKHHAEPHLRLLQKTLAHYVTNSVHNLSFDDTINLHVSSNVLFEDGTLDALTGLDEEGLLAVFEGYPQFDISEYRNELIKGINILDILYLKTNIAPSKTEARKLIEGGGDIHQYAKGRKREKNCLRR